MKGQFKASAHDEPSLGNSKIKKLIQIKSLAKDIKPSPGKSMQEIKDKTTIYLVLRRVLSGVLSLEEISNEVVE